jgi:hypothetical protein
LWSFMNNTSDFITCCSVIHNLPNYLILLQSQEEISVQSKVVAYAQWVVHSISLTHPIILSQYVFSMLPFLCSFNILSDFQACSLCVQWEPSVFTDPLPSWCMLKILFFIGSSFLVWNVRIHEEYCLLASNVV